jgi:hypothetical protein
MWIQFYGALSHRSWVTKRFCQYYLLQILSGILSTQESLVGTVLWQDGQLYDLSYFCLRKPQSQMWLEALAVLMGVSLYWELTQWVIPDSVHHSDLHSTATQPTAQTQPNSWAPYVTFRYVQIAYWLNGIMFFSLDKAKICYRYRR